MGLKLAERDRVFVQELAEGGLQPYQRDRHARRIRGLDRGLQSEKWGKRRRGTDGRFPPRGRIEGGGRRGVSPGDLQGCEQQRDFLWG